MSQLLVSAISHRQVTINNVKLMYLKNVLFSLLLHLRLYFVILLFIVI